MKKLNIVVANDFAFINGGASSVAIKSAIELANRGHNIIYFTAVGDICDELKQSNIKVINTNQKDILNNPNRIESIFKGLWNFSVYKKLRTILKDLDSNKTIVHIHGWTKALSASIYKASIDSGFKVAVTTHDYFSFCPNGGLYNYKCNKSCDKKPISMRCLMENCDTRKYSHKIWRYVRGIIQKKVAKFPNGNTNFITIGKLNEEIIRKNIKIGRFYYVPNPVEVEKHERVKVENNSIYIYVGRLSPEKGIKQFVEASKNLNLKSVIVGDGYLKDEIIKENNNINITGWLDGEGVRENLKQARVLVFPSLWYEGLPLTISEAQALGIPVIVSDSCNGRELVEEGKNGYWFECKNIDDLCSKINKTFDNETTRKLSENSYNNYWNFPFTIENHISKLEDVYKSIMKERNL